MRYLATIGRTDQGHAISAGPVKTASARVFPVLVVVEMFGARAPLNDTVNAKDVGQLASSGQDGAKAITAETIFVDNGYHAMGM